MPVYPYAAQFILLYHLRPLLPNSSHYLCIWNNAFHSDMACRRVVVGKRMKSLIYWKKIKIIFFSWKRGVFDQKLREKTKKKWSRCSTTKILGLNWPFLMIQENDFFWRNGKIEKFKDVPLSWQCMNENRQIMLVIWPVMNALPFESNRDFLAQSAQKWKPNKHNKSWNNLKQIGKNYKVRYLLISW